MTKPEKLICTVDPVCNMDLKDKHGQFMYDFDDVTYYFCSELCKGEFVKEPKKFAKKQEA